MYGLTLTALTAFVVASQALHITVGSTGGNQTSPLQYGIMFEDINHSGDGGIYAELIQNRAFQGSVGFPSNLSAWSPVNGAVLSLRNLSMPVSTALPTSMNVASGASTGQVGFSNAGWWGIDIRVQKYTGSFYVKGDYNGVFVASLQSALTNENFGSVEVQSASTSKGWTQHNYTLTPTKNAPNSNNTFSITFDASKANALDFNLISLFPPTYRNRENGMRADLMEALADLKPSFLRMPGGNNLEGDHIATRWKWNETIGPLVDRPGHRGTWGYQNTDGLGLVKYLNWCTDLNMEPLLAVWAGLSFDAVVPEDELQIYIQDALNELEFIMGSTDTKYGALRASIGYPEPWQIKYLEIGNEDQLYNGSVSYSSYRFPLFFKAIRAAYPNITIIASTVAVVPFNEAGAAGDYHEYTRPDTFVSKFGFFDNYTSEHPVLVGEYAIIQPNDVNERDAVWTGPRNERKRFPWWTGSVSEAVYAIGMERNTDHIIGASYAPLLQNLNSYEWSPDLISFTADQSQDVLSTSYEVIKVVSRTIFKHIPSQGGHQASGSKILQARFLASKSQARLLLYQTISSKRR
ncbi:alpha-L-arabinofuranosidase A [Cryomyces antarcticus]